MKFAQHYVTIFVGHNFAFSFCAYTTRSCNCGAGYPGWDITLINTNLFGFCFIECTHWPPRYIFSASIPSFKNGSILNRGIPFSSTCFFIENTHICKKLYLNKPFFTILIWKARSGEQLCVILHSDNYVSQAKWIIMCRPHTIWNKIAVLYLIFT